MNGEKFLRIRPLVVTFILGLAGLIDPLLGYEKTCENSVTNPIDRNIDEECLNHIQWAQNSWEGHFGQGAHPIRHRGLSVQCEKSLDGMVVNCWTRPWAYAGDGDAYEAVEVVSFMPENRTESRQKLLLGKVHPTW